MFEKRVAELEQRVQEGMESGKLGIKEASRLVVELQDVSGCVCKPHVNVCAYGKYYTHAQYMHVCMYVYVCMCMCVYVYVCMHIRMCT